MKKPWARAAPPDAGGGTPRKSAAPLSLPVGVAGKASQRSPIEPMTTPSSPTVVPFDKCRAFGPWPVGPVASASLGGIGEAYAPTDALRGTVKRSKLKTLSDRSGYARGMRGYSGSMSRYHRAPIPGATYFFTLNNYRRQALLTRAEGHRFVRMALYPGDWVGCRRVPSESGDGDFGE